MGTRPSSKVAVRFSKQLNVEWRCRMADFVHSSWLARQSHALREALADRERRLGYEQAHPFWCCEWTDDFWDLACEPELCAHGALTRRRLAAEINLWMSSKASCGTSGDYIGARSCLTGGFGTATIEKRGRCVADSLAAMSDLLTKDEIHAHNSFIVHMVDVLDLDPTVTNGLWAPDRLPVPGFAVIPLSKEHCTPHMRDPFALVREQYITIISLVTTRAAAAFTCGVRDVPDWHAPQQGGPVLSIRMGSDCRSSPTMMRVFGHAVEYEWFLPLDLLDPEWLNRHVNIGESIGAVVNVAVFGVMFGSFQLIHEGDNTTECAMLLGTSKVADQQYIRRRLESTLGFQECKQRLWVEQSYGTGLGFDDAGSRESHDVLAGLAAAFGRKRVPIDVVRDVPGVALLLADILRNTTPYSRPARVGKRRVRFTPSTSDLRAEQPEERGGGTAASALCTSASHVLPPTPPRLNLRRHRTSPDIGTSSAPHLRQSVRRQRYTYPHLCLSPHAVASAPLPNGLLPQHPPHRPCLCRPSAPSPPRAVKGRRSALYASAAGCSRSTSRLHVSPLPAANGRKGGASSSCPLMLLTN